MCESHAGRLHMCPCLALARERWQVGGQSVCTGDDSTDGRYIWKVSTYVWEGEIFVSPWGGISKWEVQIYAYALKRYHLYSVSTQTRGSQQLPGDRCHI